MTVASADQLVVVDYETLTSSSHDRSAQIPFLLEKAFGRSEDSLGILAVRNVPGFIEAKEKFLPMAYSLAHLPQSYLENDLTDVASMYNAGWSHGKEKLRGDQPDISKASFYFNPVTDVPGTKEERSMYPASYPCNVWPEEDKFVQVKGFKQAGKELGNLMHEVVKRVARHMDVLVSSTASESTEQGHRAGDERMKLYDALSETEKVKGRLLYYFPLGNDEPNGAIHDKESTDQQDSWIGWHYDSGFITALAGDMYMDHKTGKRLDSSPDPQAGLYVMNRKGDIVKVDVPEDCVAIQLGECTQIVTGGRFIATPHCVRGVTRKVSQPADRNESSSNADLCSPHAVSRVSFPCFVDTPPNVPLSAPAGSTREDILKAGVGTDKVPPLALRWIGDGMTFGDFLQKTFHLYYSWGDKKN